MPTRAHGPIRCPGYSWGRGGGGGLKETRNRSGGRSPTPKGPKSGAKGPASVFLSCCEKVCDSSVGGYPCDGSGHDKALGVRFKGTLTVHAYKFAAKSPNWYRYELTPGFRFMRRHTSVNIFHGANIWSRDARRVVLKANICRAHVVSNKEFADISGVASSINGRLAPRQTVDRGSFFGLAGANTVRSVGFRLKRAAPQKLTTANGRRGVAKGNGSGGSARPQDWRTGAGRSVVRVVVGPLVHDSWLCLSMGSRRVTVPRRSQP